MRKFCVGASADPRLNLSIVIAAIVLALGTVARALVIGAGGSVWTATANLATANLAAAEVKEITGQTRGMAIIPTGIFVASALLPLVWVEDAERWLRKACFSLERARITPCDTVGQIAVRR